jgi:hypothetical protein
MQFSVHSDDNYYFFSNGVKRDFGQNKVITMHDGKTIFSSVQPIGCEVAAQLPVVGTIECDP